ncbi:hypothetical protein KEM48_009590 [Puccinia striiformis f. sp. tritici PST-130]|nr:hypothetical protein KEM48_009590 [Puccinia striiformis f. sp. tritici PST-130]
MHASEAPTLPTVYLPRLGEPLAVASRLRPMHMIKALHHTLRNAIITFHRTIQNKRCLVQCKGSQILRTSLSALLLLMASWEVTGDNLFNPEIGATYFGCHRNEAQSSVLLLVARGDQFAKVRWAARLHPKKRDYRCLYDAHPECCEQGKFKALNDSPYFLNVLPEQISKCSHGGQS